MDQIAIRNRLNATRAEIWHELDSHPPAEILHFTSKHGFEGIVKSQEIWCTDIRSVNDPHEGDHGMDIILRAVTSQKLRLPPFFVKFTRSSHVDGLFGLKHSYTSYIACFSVELVSTRMWTEYADQGRGCALVFDYNLLSAGQNEGKKYALFQMAYDHKAQFKAIELTLKHVAALCKKEAFKGLDRIHYWRHEVPFELSICALRFKRQYYSEEKEMRLYIAGGCNANPFAGPDGRRRVSARFPKEAILRIERPATSILSEEAIRSTLKEHGYPELPIVARGAGQASQNS